MEYISKYAENISCSMHMKYSTLFYIIKGRQKIMLYYTRLNFEIIPLYIGNPG